MRTRHPQIFLTPSVMCKGSSQKVGTISAPPRRTYPPVTMAAPAYSDALGSIFTLDLPAQELLIGGVEALGF